LRPLSVINDVAERHHAAVKLAATIVKLAATIVKLAATIVKHATPSICSQIFYVRPELI
jgi:hypothetical protein